MAIVTRTPPNGIKSLSQLLLLQFTLLAFVSANPHLIDLKQEYEVVKEKLNEVSSVTTKYYQHCVIIRGHLKSNLYEKYEKNAKEIEIERLILKYNRDYPNLTALEQKDHEEKLQHLKKETEGIVALAKEKANSKDVLDCCLSSERLQENEFTEIESKISELKEKIKPIKKEHNKAIKNKYDKLQLSLAKDLENNLADLRKEVATKREEAKKRDF